MRVVRRVAALPQRLLERAVRQPEACRLRVVDVVAVPSKTQISRAKSQFLC
jgi:hypothetical protein